MSTLTKQSLSQIQNDILTAIAQVEAKHGVQIKFAGGKYTDTNATLKLELNTIQGGRVIPKEEADFIHYAQRTRFGFNLGDQVRDYQGTYTVCGYLPKGRTYKFVVKDASGQKYKMSYNQIISGLVK
jgi:hypothetical protein